MHCPPLAANRTFISLTPAVVTSNMGFELLSVLQGFVAKPANFCAWNYVGYHPFNPFFLVDLAGIYPKTPQHIYLLIMALLKFLLETCNDRWLWLWLWFWLRFWFQFRLGLGLELRLCGCSSRGITTQSLVWKFSPRDEITEITSGVDSVGLFGEIIPWCQSDRISPQIFYSFIPLTHLTEKIQYGY